MEDPYVPVKPFVLRAVKDGLRHCPEQHREEVEAQIESEFRYAVLTKEVYNPRGLALTIAKRRIIDHLKRHPIPLDETVMSLPSQRGNVMDLIDLRVSVEEGLKQLVETDREAAGAFLSWLDGARPEEIATSQGVSAATVRRRIDRVRGFLQRLLREEQ